MRLAKTQKIVNVLWQIRARGAFAKRFVEVIRARGRGVTPNPYIYNVFLFYL